MNYVQSWVISLRTLFREIGLDPTLYTPVCLYYSLISEWYTAQ
jgi:hypothetical protein